MSSTELFFDTKNKYTYFQYKHYNQAYEMYNNKLHLGRTFLEANNIPAARKMAGEVLSLDPNDENALSLVYDCLKKTENHDETYEFAHEWIRLHPLSEDAHSALIYSCMGQKKRKNECLNAIETFKTTFPESIIQVQLFESVYDILWGPGDKAVVLMESLRDQYPDVQSLFVIHGHAALVGNQLIKARQLAKEVIRTVPNDDNAWRLLAISSFRVMRFSEARSAAREVLRLKPEAKIMREIIFLSRIVYFPPFLLSQFMMLMESFILDCFRENSILKYLIDIGFFILFGTFVLSPLMKPIAKTVSDFGIPHFTYVFLFFLIGWLILLKAIDQGYIKDSKTKPVELPNY